jgi:cytoskeletal protein RodZ
MSVGAELAEARERLGLSVEEVSARTKIKIERLIAIEEMDAAQLPSLVYLKGFLRAYAAQVDLDPDAVTGRYLAELEIVSPSYGEGAGTVLPASSRAPELSTRSVSDDAAGPLDGEPEFDVDELRRPDVPPEAEPLLIDHGANLPSETRFFREYIAPADDRDGRLASSSSSGRSRRNYAAAFFVVTVALAAGWFLGAHFDNISISRLTEPFARTEADAPASDDSTNQGERTGASDGRAGNERGRVGDERSDRRAERDEPTAAAAPSRASTGAPERAANVERAVPAETVVDREPGATTVEPAPRDAAGDRRASRAAQPEADTERAATETAATPPEPEPAVPTSRASPADEAPAATNDRAPSPRGLSGRWALTNRVESSSYGAFRGLNVGFHLQLRQEGNRISGTGQKWMENGKPLPAASRTPISVEGTLKGSTLELSFTERGTRRTSAGRFVLTVADDGTMHGSFVSDAADSQGTSLARRMEPR